MIELLEALGKIDWIQIGTGLAMIGSLVVAVLQKLGKTKEAAKVASALDQAKAVITGVENVAKEIKPDTISKTLAECGIVLSGDEDLEALGRAIAQHTKQSIKKTAMAFGVDAELAELVSNTTKRLDPVRLREKLSE